MKKKIIIGLLVLIAIVAIVAGVIITKNKNRENRKYEVQVVSEHKYFAVRENEKFGVIDTQGKKIIDTKYDSVKIPNPEKDIFVCYQNNSTKVLNAEGTEIFKEYANVEPLRLKNVSGDLVYEKSILKYKENEKYGIIDISGNKITDAIYENIDTLQYKEGELLVRKDGKSGVININGYTLVDIKYDKVEADQFYEDNAGYKNAGYIVKNTTTEGYRYGYITVDGDELLGIKYNDLSRILDIKEDIYVICAENGKYGLFKNGKNVIPNEYQAISYSESCNVVIALKGKKYGVISMDGKILIPFESTKPIDITGEFIYVEDENGNIEVFNKEGKATNMLSSSSIVKVPNTDYELHIDSVNDNTTYSIYVNNKKKNKNEYKYIQYLFGNNFIASNDDGKLGVITDNDVVLIPFTYDSIQIVDNTEIIQAIQNNIVYLYSNKMEKIAELQEGKVEEKEKFIVLSNEDKMIYISKDGKEIDRKEALPNSKIFAQKSGDKWGFVNQNGETVIDYIYERVTEVDEYGFAGIKQNGVWGIISNDGKIIVEPKYEIYELNLNFIGQYYRVIYGNGEIYYSNY